MDNNERFIEEWRKIEEFPFYEVSSLGRVRSKDRTITRRNGQHVFLKGKLLKLQINNKGYVCVQLSNDYGKHRVLVHRLVGKAFVPNIHKKPCINHIDNSPLNNRVGNLEWVTKQENTDHMVKQGRNKRTQHWFMKQQEAHEKQKKPVIATNIETRERLTFCSVNSTREKGFSPGQVSLCCNHYIKTHKGYSWEFENTIFTEHARGKCAGQKRQRMREISK